MAQERPVAGARVLLEKQAQGTVGTRRGGTPKPPCRRSKASRRPARGRSSNDGARAAGAEARRPGLRARPRARRRRELERRAVGFPRVGKADEEARGAPVPAARPSRRQARPVEDAQVRCRDASGQVRPGSAGGRGSGSSRRASASDWATSGRFVAVEDHGGESAVEHGSNRRVGERRRFQGLAAGAGPPRDEECDRAARLPRFIEGGGREASGGREQRGRTHDEGKGQAPRAGRRPGEVVGPRHILRFTRRGPRQPWPSSGLDDPANPRSRFRWCR